MTQTGTTLKYHGVKFPRDIDHVAATATPVRRFEELFKNIGALVIRYHIGQGQRAGLLAQVTRPNYAESPLEKPAAGRDQSDLFEPPAGCTKTTAQNFLLERIAAWPLGRSKLLNDRAQPLIHTNRMACGEQQLWEIIHSAVWTTGISLPFELDKQGFLYLAAPEDINSAEYAAISLALQQGRFVVCNDEATTTIQVQTEARTWTLSTTRFAKLKLTILPEATPQSNGFMLNDTRSDAPPRQMGWILHPATSYVFEPTDCEDLLRVIQIAKGGFYELTPTQQRLMQAGRLTNNGMGLFTQNQAFNAMIDLFYKIEPHCHFNPLPLITTSLQGVPQRVAKLFEETEALDDFLLGILLSEMVQHLAVSREHSERSALPKRFTNPFLVTRNNARAIAYAFDIRDGAGRNVLTMQTPDFFDDERLIDVNVNGELLLPSFTNRRHCAALLATAILVAEQMILEQRVPIADVIEPSALLAQFIAFGSGEREAPSGDGLQFPHCSEAVTTLREILGTNCLIELCQKWYYAENPSNESLTVKEKAACKHLYAVCHQIQQLPTTSAASLNSRGAVFGLAAMISVIAPELATELELDIDQARFSSAATAAKSEPSALLAKPATNTSAALMAHSALFACPYLAAKRRAMLLPNESLDHAAKTETQPATSVKRETCSRFFKRLFKAGMVAAAAGLTRATAINLRL